MTGRRTRSGKGFGEAQSGFALTFDRSALLAAYGHACAFTGADLSAMGAADPAVALLALSPAVPAADPTFFVPACDEAIHAYDSGHIAIGPRYNFIVDLERIDPEFLDRLNPNGRLRLPADAALRPASAVLKAHRDAFVEGLIGEP